MDRECVAMIHSLQSQVHLSVLERTSGQRTNKQTNKQQQIHETSCRSSFPLPLSLSVAVDTVFFSVEGNGRGARSKSR